ncbi:MAG: aspartate racemase [Calditrichia bacterium]
MGKIIGIIGGMGPLSTVELMRKVIELTPAKADQDHIRMLVDNRPQIPDRTEFILGKGPSPVPMLQESARMLEKWGADVLAIPCNTAHAFIEEIRTAVHIPILDMLELTSNYLQANFPQDSLIGILSTTGSRRIQLFEKYFHSYRLIYPEDTIQETHIMQAVYGERGIKSRGVLPENRRLLWEAARSLQTLHPRAIVVGCTEIALAFKNKFDKIPVINPLHILARELVNFALK